MREIIASRDLTTKFAEAFYRAILKEVGPFRFDLGTRMVPFGLASRFFAIIQVKRTLVRSTN